MHKTTRQIWTSSSSSSCFFCDFRLFLSEPLPPRIPQRATLPRVPGTRSSIQHRSISHSSTTVNARVHPQQHHRGGGFLNRSGIHSGSLPQSTRVLKQGLGTTGDSTRSATNITTSENGFSLSCSQQQQSGGLVRTTEHRVLESSRRIQGGSLLSRNISTTSASTASSELDGETSPMLHMQPSTSTSAEPTPSSSLPSLSTPDPNLATFDVADPSPTSDFRALFPGNTSAKPQPEAPWRKSHMKAGTNYEEALRKSVYEREPVERWWATYKQVTKARRWQRRDIRDSSKDAVFVLTDFLRFIGCLKVSSRSPEDGLHRLERLFEDYHRALGLPTSNVKMYTAVLDTLTFWKQQHCFPDWIAKFKAKIVSPIDGYPLIPKDAQEQYQSLMRVLGNTGQVEPILQCLEDLKSSQSEFLMPTTNAYDSVLEVYLRRKDTASAMRIFQEMRERPGCEPRLSSYNILLKGHLDNKDARSAQRVLETLLLSEHRPDIDTFNLLMSGYLRMGDADLVTGFYKGLDEYGLAPNAKTYRILLRSYQKQGQVDKVLELFHRLMESPHSHLHPGPEAYRILLQSLATNGRMPDALRVLRELTEEARFPIPLSIYHVFLTQYASEGQAEKARKVLDRIMADGLALVDGSINPLIQVYLSRKDYDKVREMTDLMQQQGISPTNITFHIMMNSAKYSGNMEGAMQLYYRMLGEGVEPDVWTYNTLLDVITSKMSPQPGNTRWKGDHQAVTKDQIQEFVPKIESLLAEMNSRGVKPDVVTYGKLIHQYVLLRDIEQAEMVFHEMVKSGIMPNAFAFNSLMDGFTVIEEMDKAVELFRKMPKYGVEPDSVTFTTLIKGFSNLKEIKTAQDFANSMQQIHGAQFQMDRHGLHTMMQLAQKSDQPCMALDFFEIMRSKGLEADEVTYTILANALSREIEKTRNRERWLASNGDRRKRRSVTPAALSGDNAVMPFSTQVEALESILEIIHRNSDGKTMNQAEITTMLSAYFRLGRPQVAIDFFRSVLWRGVRGLQLSTANCGALLNGLLAPELGRRYDGSVLNMYAKMLIVTRNRLVQEGCSSALSSPSPSPPPSSPSSSFSSMQDLPGLDLVTISILLQAFTHRKSWALVLQIWNDYESIGAENLYPFKMPLEFLGFAAQAYHRTSEDSQQMDKRPRRQQESRTRSGELDSYDSSDHGQESFVKLGSSHEEKAGQLLRELWKAHPRMGKKWSIQIYGFDIFKGQSTTSSSSKSKASSSRSSTLPSSSSSLSSTMHRQSADLRTYLSGYDNHHQQQQQQQQHQHHNHPQQPFSSRD